MRVCTRSAGMERGSWVGDAACFLGRGGFEGREGWVGFGF
jgi:hypothetical protein